MSTTTQEEHPHGRPRSADWRARATLSIPEAGRVIGLGRNAAYAAAGRGELPVVALGARRFVPVARLRRMLGELPDEGAA